MDDRSLDSTLPQAPLSEEDLDTQSSSSDVAADPQSIPLTVELQKTLYAAQRATLSFRGEEPFSVEADLYLDHVWFTGIPNYSKLLHDLQELGYIEMRKGGGLVLTEKGMRTEVSSDAFSKQQLAEYKTHVLDRVQAWFKQKNAQELT